MFAVALLQGLDGLVQLAERVLALLVGREGGLLELAPAVLLQVGQLHADAHQRREIPVLAVECLLIAVQRLFQRGQLRFELPGRLVGLPLGEGMVQRGASRLVVAGVEQIDGHVERGMEARMQRVDALAGQCGGGRRYEIAMVDDDRVSDRIDAATAGAAGQLGELPRCQRHMPAAVELLQLFDDDTARRHVDAQRERLRREDHLHQSLFKQAFDYLPEQRDHAGVMGREALLQREPEPGELQRLEILLAQLPGDHLVDDGADTPHLVLGGEFQPRIDALLDGLIAAVAREYEIDAGKHVEIVELVDHRPALGRVALRRHVAPRMAAAAGA